MFVALCAPGAAAEVFDALDVLEQQVHSFAIGVRGIEARRELFVGNNSLRQVSAAADDLGPEHHRRG